MFGLHQNSLNTAASRIVALPDFVNGFHGETVMKNWFTHPVAEGLIIIALSLLLIRNHDVSDWQAWLTAIVLLWTLSDFIASWLKKIGKRREGK